MPISRVSLCAMPLVLTAAVLAQSPQPPLQAATAPPVQTTSQAAVAADPNAVTEANEAGDLQQEQAGSHVRVVRLSQARGAVDADRGGTSGFETAPPNLPIVQGTRLRTAEGVAEVEFEDSSVLRLAANTELVFTELSRTPSGSTVSRMRVLHGTVYANLEKTKGNTIELQAAQGSVALPPGAEVRFVVGNAALQLATIKGKITLSPANGAPIEISKNKELRLDAANPASPQQMAEIGDQPFDEWNAEQDGFHKAYAHGNGLAGSPYTFGLDDLNYYGSFQQAGDCGRIWRPYFASAAWDPYSNGSWAFYPGVGYSWVSVYPWGWAPFHYGSWINCGAAGWGWMPGGNWGGLGFGAGYGGYGGYGDYGGSGYGISGGRPRIPHGGGGGTHPWHHPPHHPVLPPQTPRIGHGTLITVNKAPLAASTLNARTHEFTFRNDSAGLGIPRDTFGKLNRASSEIAKGHPVNLPMAPVQGGVVQRVENGHTVARTGVEWRPAGGGNATVRPSGFVNRPEPGANMGANAGGGIHPGSSGGNNGFHPPSSNANAGFHPAAPAGGGMPSFHSAPPPPPPASAPSAPAAAHK